MRRYFGLAPSKNWTKEELIQYDNAFMAEQDARGRVALAEKEAKKEGEKIGEARGEVKGEARGLEKKEIEAVLGMNKNNIPIPVIADSLNISEEKVKQIIQQFKTK